ncbi:MAG: DNA double-strand break repair nuclease NurA [Anaerolineae bacterium]|nr:DNA double-strand break repair nuclease NurA [Anaerolineae bacterium]
MLHIERLKSAIKTLGAHASVRHRTQTSETTTARAWLTHIPAPEELRACLEPLTRHPHATPIALPATEDPLTTQYIPPLPHIPPSGTTVIGVDGSQIYPDRHAPVLYYLIQVGALVFRYNGQTPTPHSRATLYYEDHDIYEGPGQLVSIPHIGMRRTLEEIRYLVTLTEAEHKEEASPPIFTLTDGPLLWTASNRPDREEMEAQRKYLATLSHLCDAGGAPLGFIERPGGRFFIDLLWAGQLTAGGSLPPETLAEAYEKNPLQHVTDDWLMQVILEPGARTVWLERRSDTNQAHEQAGHCIWFCYLNAGTPGNPVIARIEVPNWVAKRETWTTLLHCTLLHQAHMLQGNPYVLARAHEEALVTTRDKAALDDIIQRQLLEAGIVAQASEKARQKSYLGRR